jgi:hypothetical protein
MLATQPNIVLGPASDNRAVPAPQMGPIPGDYSFAGAYGFGYKQVNY